MYNTAMSSNTHNKPETPYKPKKRVDQESTKKTANSGSSQQPIINPLTRKQKAFVQHLIANPSATASEAYQASYATKGNKNTIAVEAHRTLNKPQVKLELDKYSGIAETTLLEVMNTSNNYSKSGTRDGAAYAAVAVTAAKDILDRVHGKATQRVESTSKAVTINIDLTGVSTPEEITEV